MGAKKLSTESNSSKLSLVSPTNDSGISKKNIQAKPIPAFGLLKVSIVATQILAILTCAVVPSIVKYY
jgi:hypothetical protein